ncbi:class II aldolase/adducin family protein [Paraburkholderia phenazinium]|uniref:Ribulose-5-phosphate 4-epimerase/Fuculose-1-phosphate aldolase n=1 Tax=Paraburkholderia phenazinium TaxID=60549 RepID=A0A1G8N3G9_9BURK|nr:class II aldolase/adducin family protein [Paraburkholderia phenazinium]SDI74809.1 Ribulose-5-phosphate 4-epimerase/Fuculose-1-phosphate aldolase [Paraburkholderia phenazinium]
MINTALDIPDVRHLVSPEEWQVRLDLAAAYRLVALFGWDDLVFTHISARVPGHDDQFLINPYGFFFEEITASSLVKVDHHGQPVMPTPFDVNPAGFVIHSAVHEARREVTCVLHTHTPHGVAVAAQQEGLLPLSQQASFVLTSLAYHAYEGVALREAEKARLVADLGSANYMMLRNHGLLTCGRSIPEAFQAMYLFEAACRIQIFAQGGGKLTEVPQSIIDTMGEQAREVSKGQGANLVWPGLLRRLARRNPGYDL